MNSKPLISIIIPVYNGSNYMAEAIDSALAQTYENIEIIVVNDGSRDDSSTEKIALSYGDKIRYIHKENGGSSSALNTGIRSMKGEYFSWLSHDDLYLPEKVEKQYEMLCGYEADNVMAVCAGYLIDEKGTPILAKSNDLNGKKTADQVLALLTHGRMINGCGVLMPKKIIDRVGFFDEGLTYLNDVDYWYRTVLQDTEIVYSSEKLIKTRVHGQQVSVSKKHLFAIERHTLAQKILDNIDSIKTDRQSSLKHMAYFCANENLGEELSRVLNLIAENEKVTVSTRFRLRLIYIKGLITESLKKIRRKLLFHR